MAESSASQARHLTYAGFAAVVLVYLAVIQGGGLVLGRLADVSDAFTLRGVVVGYIVPIGLALVLICVVITRLRWWRPVLHDDRPTARWVWVVPALFVLGVAAGVDYGALADKGVTYVVALVLATQLVGWGEEGMFRGVGVTVLRRHGLTEGRVALWSSAIFGAVHLSNVVGHGISALPQAVMVSFAGYFFYLMRRVSRGNVVNSVVHGLFDFALLSGTAVAVDQGVYPGTVVPVLLYPVVGIILLVRRHHIEPQTPGPSLPSSTYS